MAFHITHSRLYIVLYLEYNPQKDAGTFSKKRKMLSVDFTEIHIEHKRENER